MNLVDPDSSLMRKSRRDGWQQAYSAQIVVDVDGSQLIVAEYVTETPSDANELEPAFGIIKAAIGFRQFLQRGKQNVGNEWTLVCTAYNPKRLWALKPG